jgi:hypothetical protein
MDDLDKLPSIDAVATPHRSTSLLERIMPKLIIHEGTYYWQSDEAAFYQWLQSIPGVTAVVGKTEGLVVTLRSKRLSRMALRDLLALHFRYGLPMHALAQFETSENRSWFRDPKAYWHSKVFGKQAARSNKRFERSRIASSVSLGGNR